MEFQNDLTVMSLAQTPLLEWFVDPLTFSVSREHDGDALVEWINSFVDTQNPDMVMMNGPNADVPHLRNAVLRSRAASRLIDQPSIPGHRAVVMGAAQAAKDRLESQIDDCSEPGECIGRGRQPGGPAPLPRR